MCAKLILLTETVIDKIKTFQHEDDTDGTKISKITTWNMTLPMWKSQALRELAIYNPNILGLSEMGWTGSGKMIPEKLNTSVGFILDNEASKALSRWASGGDHIIPLHSHFCKIAFCRQYSVH